jgi:hypothetical protein
VEEFSRHGYQLVLLGERPGLVQALRRVGVEVPEASRPNSAEELRSFLTAQPPVDPALLQGERL